MVFAVWTLNLFDKLRKVIRFQVYKSESAQTLNEYSSEMKYHTRDSNE